MFKKMLSCRRTVVAVFAISCLTTLGMYHGIDISGIALAISGCVAAVAGANAYENKGRPKAPEAPAAAKPKVDSPD